MFIRPECAFTQPKHIARMVVDGEGMHAHRRQRAAQLPSQCLGGDGVISRNFRRCFGAWGWQGDFPSAWLWQRAWQDGIALSVIPLPFVSEQRLRASFCKIECY